MILHQLPFAISAMTMADIPTISWIEQAVFSLPWSSSAFSYEIKYNPSSYYIVLRYKPWGHPDKLKLPFTARVRQHLKRESSHDASILGYGGLWTILDEAHICTLALRENWRGHGLGELLLCELVQAAQKNHARVVTLEARVSNTVAHKLYEKYGFEVVGRRKAYYSDNREDAYIMTTPDITTDDYRCKLEFLAEQLERRLVREAAELPPIVTKGTLLADASASDSKP